MTTKRNCQRTYVFTHTYIFFFFKIQKEEEEEEEQLLKVQRLNERKLYIDYNSKTKQTKKKSFE